MQLNTTLSKMPAYINGQVHYLLKTDNDFLKINDCIGREFSIEFVGEKYCASCGNQFTDLYRMGFCKNCFFTSPMAGESIIRPELSRAHLGEEDRDLAFEKGYQLQEHVVYLANSGGLKVGVTRQQQVPTRWIDQGATQAIVLAKTSNRYEAGMIEVDMKNHVADKTAWQRMLKNEDAEVNLVEEKERLAGLLSADLQHFVCDDNEIHSMDYPVEHYPTKVKAINLDKNAEVKAVLQGIRGQYLIFEGGGVLNLRGHTGYRVKISF
ncbi:DUF2797 domain-containing protein [Owenweeksia hongkongensis]|uniref:DUF2797 domain-containing protein n=1 Tax=Owenweeksia hongkongensis TaxID=253245 RepID=UPI003A90011F